MKREKKRRSRMGKVTVANLPSPVSPLPPPPLYSSNDYPPHHPTATVATSFIIDNTSAFPTRLTAAAILPFFHSRARFLSFTPTQ
jgi:hypothetical protein